MNTIIWKGVSSTTIEGLLISELPPISKPKMRVKETMIDGRDGSVIEDLGYEPYNKPVTIGLRGSFDIDKVIKYFSGEGEIIFSNEPDKVYSAKVINQVDYNRLLRFRQAVVSFRVQPFKHKYIETYKETQTATATGTSIVVSDSGNATIKSISVGDGGKTEGQVEIKTTGKNLLPFPYYEDSKLHGGVQYTVSDDGRIKAKGTAGSYSIFILNKTLELVDGETYSISGGTYDVPVVVCYDNASGTRVYQSEPFTWSKDYTFVQFHIVTREGKTVDEIICPMLEVGTTASTFVPYQKSVSTYDYASNTLSDQLQTFAPNTTITNADGATMTIEYFKNLEVFNEGLENSKPIMVLHGSGTVGISVNGIHIFDYTFPEGETEVVIDSEKQDAYLGEVLKNRNMNGEFPVLLAGSNTIGWSGDVESIEVLPRSRWL